MTAVEAYPTPTPKPFTKEEYETWVAASSAQDQEIKSCLRHGRQAMWQAAASLYEFSQNAGWLALGYEGLGEWLADPDITLSRATYFRLVESYRELVIVRQIPQDTVEQLDLSKVSIAMPALKAGTVTVEDVMSDAEALGARDMREKYRKRVRPGAGDGLEDVPDADVVVEGQDLDEDDDPEAFDPPEVDPDALYGTQTVPRGVAATLTACLRQVLSDLGKPERRIMSKGLREQIEYALSMADDEGLTDV